MELILLLGFATWALFFSAVSAGVGGLWSPVETRKMADLQR
jgi:hypothetical protein